MNPPTRILRPVAALAVLLGASACSSIDNYAGAADDSGDDGYGESEDSSGSEGQGTDSESGTEDTGDTGTDTSGDESDPEEGLPDPMLVTSICDPLQGQVIAYDLAEAHAEIAPELVRESVMTSAIVPPIPLSTRPFFNHFHFDHPPATETTLAVSGELWKPQSMLNVASPRFQLQFAVSGPELSDADRPAIDLAIVVDIGPSMVGFPLELANEALLAVGGSLRAGDRVTLISAGDQAQVLSSALVQDGMAPSLPNQFAELPPASAAVIGEALDLAYAQLAQLAELEPLPEARSRVMLISAGHFAIDPSLLELVDGEAELGTTLTTVGVGAVDQFAESSLRALAGVGKGASVYGPHADPLWLALGEQFTSKMIAAATDVEVTLILPPGLAISERDPSYGGDMPSEIELGWLGPNDALVFHQELESCGELDLGNAIRVQLEWSEPGVDEIQQLIWEWPLIEAGEGELTTLKGAAVLAYTDALIAYRDNLDADARYGALLDALSHISEALGKMPEDPDLIEMSEVLAKLEST
ncbi:hypothetical protein ACNOYE_10025 [Nannocystaceae bacterium ST9]